MCIMPRRRQNIILLYSTAVRCLFSKQWAMFSMAVAGQRGLPQHAIPPQLARSITCQSTSIIGYERDHGRATVTNDTVSSVIENQHLLALHGPRRAAWRTEVGVFSASWVKAEDDRAVTSSKKRVVVNVYHRRRHWNAENTVQKNSLGFFSSAAPPSRNKCSEQASTHACTFFRSVKCKFQISLQ